MANELQRGTVLLKELVLLMQDLSDEDVGKLFNDSNIITFLGSILNMTEYKKYPTIAAFLLANKKRSTTIAVFRYLIQQNFCFKITKDNQTGFVSPYFIQGFDDG